MKTVPVKDVFPTDWRDVFAPDARRIGVGYDPATTTKGTSNPSSLVFTQQVGLTYFPRLILRFKAADPAIPTAIIRYALENLPHGLKARKLCIDATNERYFAVDLRKALAKLVPVDLVVSSEKTNYLGEEMTFKAYLGNQLVNTIEDGYFPLPPANWVKDDFRLVNRDRGSFEADIGPDGGHGDCFDGCKLSLHALVGAGGPVDAAGARVGQFGAPPPDRPGAKNPFAHLMGATAPKRMS